jgi:hypothetical protein
MKNIFLFWLLRSQNFAIGSLLTCHLLCNVCKMVLYFVRKFIGRLHWIVAKSLSLILLLWLGNMFCAIVLLVLQRQKCVGSYVYTKLNCCFKSHTTFFAWCRHFLPSLQSPIPMVYLCICCNWILAYGFVSHLC